MSALQEMQDDIRHLADAFDAFMAIPEWIPLTKGVAEQYGYKTLDGLREWCYRNLPPDLYRKNGKAWEFHRSSSWRIKHRVK
ncbi:hypothetical protein ACM66T_09990 [Sulfurimonas sp. ST-25]|uniref:hypothetical protein n=1 Tax=Sulfurimonas sp. ST-25 TaxID=3400151 RepID=UPI003A88E70E